VARERRSGWWVLDGRAWKRFQEFTVFRLARGELCWSHREFIGGEIARNERPPEGALGVAPTEIAGAGFEPATFGL